ncbi:MAG: hypothetical protein ACXVBO_20760 [Isosphaeraceae bacterium]
MHRRRCLRHPDTGSTTRNLNEKPRALAGDGRSGCQLKSPFAVLAFALFRSNGALWLPETNAGSSTIFRDELDAGRLQRALNRFEVVRYRNRSACLEISDGTFADLRFGRQVGLRKLDQCARGAALRRRHSIILKRATIFDKDTE